MSRSVENPELAAEEPGAPRIAFIRGVFDFSTYFHGHIKLVILLSTP